MKAQILSLIAGIALALVSTESANGQTHYGASVELGVKGGATGSRVFFNPSINQSFKFGGMAGLQFRYIEESHFGLIAECNFIQMGWNETYKETSYSYSRTLHYLQIPVLAHIYFGRRGRFFVNAGPQIGFFIGESSSSNYDVDNYKNLTDYPYPNRVNDQLTLSVQNKIDYGISAGLGGEFSINNRNALSLEARFYYGLGNIFKACRRDPFRASNQMSVQLTLGYWLRLHR